MKNTKSGFETRPPADSQRKMFTLDEANRSLPYVSRVTLDIRSTYRQAVSLQEQIDTPLPGDEIEKLRDEYEKTIVKLNGFVDELGDVGVELKDYDLGLVDFPAKHEEREICLCWKVGEKTILAWHETAAGYSGRRDIDTLTPETPTPHIPS